MAETTKPNLYQKLLMITEAVGKIEKTGSNTSQNYKFIEQAAVVAEVRVQLAKHGVMIIPETVSRTMERYVTMKPGYKPTDPPKEQATVHANVKSRYTLVNADNPSETMVCEWDAGEALDTSDKATNKAVTASDKSFLMKLFKISDKDDPDAGSPAATGTPHVSTTTQPYNRDDFQPEPSRDVNADVIEELISDDALLKLGGEIKKKGIADMKKVNVILDELAKTKGVPHAQNLTVKQGRELYARIRDEETKDNLELLLENQ